MKLIRKVGSTSEIWQIFVADSSSTTGAGLPGLVFNTSSLTAYYHRDTDTTATAISLVTMTVGTFTSSGLKEIDATNMPGWYQFCPPNAALASGAKSCSFHLKGAANMAPLPIEVDLDAQVDVTFWNSTAVSSPATAGIPDVNVKNINNVAAATPGAAGGLFIAGSNAATTIAGLTTGAFSATTITASGAVAFQSTFAVTTSTALGALSCSTLTASGAVAFQSTFAVTTSTSLATLSCTTLTASGAVAFQSTFATTGTTTFNAFTITNALTVGDGVVITATTTNRPGISSTGNGTGPGLLSTGGSGGGAAGAALAGGTGGNGLNLNGTDGLNILATSDGMHIVAGVDGIDISGVTGTTIKVTGNVSVGGTTILTGAVSLGSTLGIMGTVTAGAITSTGAFTVGSFVINGTSNVAQTGDSFGRIGVAGVGLTNLGDTRIADLDATVSSRASATIAPSWYTAPGTAPTVSQIATGVWQDTTAGDFTVSGSIGQTLFTGVAPGVAGGMLKLGSNAASITFTGGVTIGAALTVGTNFSVGGATTFTGPFTASNASNAVTLGATEDAAIAAEWGASVVGNSRTRDYFLQGGTNKVAFDVPGAGQYTIYQTDDSTSLKVGTYTTSAVDPVVSLDPA